jgi:hypothetical protein
MLILVCTHLYKYTERREALSIKFKSFFVKNMSSGLCKTQMLFEVRKTKTRACVAANKHAGSSGTVAFGTGMALHDWRHAKDDCWISGVENVTNRIVVFVGS